MAKMILLSLLLLSLLSQAQTNLFELVYVTDHQTGLSGSILLQCRDATTTEPLDVDQTRFWLNRTAACDPDLKATADVQVIRADNGIKFNLTHNLEGVYTCGRLVIQENEIMVQESTPMTLICKYSNVHGSVSCIGAIILLNITVICYCCIPHAQHSKPLSQYPADRFKQPSRQGLVTLLYSLAQSHQEHSHSHTR
jgi:hypothetical protein